LSTLGLAITWVATGRGARPGMSKLGEDPMEGYPPIAEHGLIGDHC
jgi:hypothetical protein